MLKLKVVRDIVNIIALLHTEEVLSTDSALWWSHDGTGLLYASFNDTPVREYSFPLYGLPSNQYTHIESIPYPKVSAVR